jgi:endoglucanase
MFLLSLYEMNTTFWSSVTFDIPESTNQYPDIVDEAMWSLDFWARMQRQDGGTHTCRKTITHSIFTSSGVGGGIEADEHPIYGQVSWESTQRWFCYAPDPWVTYTFAAR